MTLFAELTRRKVFKVGGAYLVVAWLAVQGASIGFPAFDAPPWALRIFILVALLGFPIALVFAWAFEITPNGVRPESGARSTRAILAVAAVLTLLAFVWYFKGQPSYRAETPPPSPNVSAAAAKPASADATIAAVPISRKSIAVLPFENLSEEKSNAYFATGMQDEILTRLAGIHDLKVISRTSTEQYASHPPNLKIVAEQLGVATVLEGSVQRADGKVRINLQLIDARNDSHLWAQNYDRDLKDVFAVQSDVAEKVADALKAQLLPAESARIASVPTRNPEAYDRFLKAEYFTNQIDANTAKNPAEAVRKAADLYASAIAADSDFALAYARLSYVRGSAYWHGNDPSPQAIDAAQAAATHALALQPNLPEAHLAMGFVHYWGHRNYVAALAEFATARAGLPNDTQVIAAIAYVHRRQGNLLQAIDEFEQAAVLDPRDTKLPRDLGDTLGYLRRYAEAETACERSLALAPDNIEANIIQATVLQMRGDLEGSSRVLAAIPTDYDPQGSVSLARFNLALAMRQPDAALAALAQAPAWLSDLENNTLVPVMLLRGRALAAKDEIGPARAAFVEAQQALQGLSRELQAQAGAQSNLAAVYAGLGQKDAALTAARRATELLPMSQDMLDGSFYLARLAKIEAQVGESESALDHIKQLLAAPAGYEVSAASLRTDPAWDPLRKDPRFQKLLDEHPNDDQVAHP
jgi:TolB-like protein